MATGPVVHGKNHGIAKKLASSDQGTREKAIGLLILWLSCEQQIGEDELKRIWKGLFYCVWHADKAPVQAELIERLASLLESVEVDLSVSFFKVFLSTMRREWAGIDRLRMDKFYLLLRKFLCHMFKVLENGRWDHEIVTKFMDALEERTFLARDRFPALGVNLHFADIFWHEFRGFLPVPQGTLELLLEPFYSILRTSSDKALLRRVRENIFNPLLDDARSLVDKIEKGSDGDNPSANIGFLLDSRSIAPRLFDLASSPATAQANRKVLYELNDEFSKLAKLFESGKSSGLQISGSVNGNENGVSRDSTPGRTEDSPQIAAGNAVSSSARLRKRQGRALSASSGSGQPAELPKVKKTKTVKEQETGKSTRRKSPEKVSVKVSDLADGDDAKVVNEGVEVSKKRRSTDRGRVDISRRKKKSDSKVSGSIETVQSAQKKRTSKVVNEERKRKRLDTKLLDGDGETVLQDKRRTDVVSQVEKTDLPGQKKPEKKRGKKKGKRAEANGEAGLISALNSEAGVTRDIHPNGSARDSGTVGDADIGTQMSRIESGCVRNVREDVNDVAFNLEKKFDIVATEGSSAANRETDLESSLDTPGDKKRRGKVSAQAAGDTNRLTVDIQNAGASRSASEVQHSIPVLEGSTVTGKEPTKKIVKKVRFVLKNNVICKPHGPLPPLSVRTPPSATPRGSALKSGVQPGPIRTRPIRIVRGASLKSRRRTSGVLTKSKQKPKSPSRKLKRKTRVVRVIVEK